MSNLPKVYAIYDKCYDGNPHHNRSVESSDSEDYTSLNSPSSVEYSDDQEYQEDENFESYDWYPDVLVLGPGGVKGTLELGALYILHEKKLLDDIHTYAGVSVGAIISLLIIVGYSIKEIIVITVDTNILQDVENFNLFSASSNGGLISSDPIRRKLMSLVTNKMGLVPTLKQLYRATGLALVTIAHNMTKDETEYFDPFITPNISCVDAVMLSINMPIVFYRLVYDNNVYVDGALGNPYPINYFDELGRYNILGLYIKNGKRFVSNSSELLYQTNINNVAYISKLIDTPMEQHRYTIIRNSSDRCKHIELNTDVIDSIGITVTAQQKADMIIAGLKEGKAFAASLEKGTYKSPVKPMLLYGMLAEHEKIEDLSILDEMNKI